MKNFLNFKLVPKAVTEFLSPAYWLCHWSILSGFHLPLDAEKIRLEENVTTCLWNNLQNHSRVSEQVLQ